MKGEEKERSYDGLMHGRMDRQREGEWEKKLNSDEKKD